MAMAMAVAIKKGGFKNERDCVLLCVEIRLGTRGEEMPTYLIFIYMGIATTIGATAIMYSGGNKYICAGVFCIGVANILFGIGSKVWAGLGYYFTT